MTQEGWEIPFPNLAGAARWAGRTAAAAPTRGIPGLVFGGGGEREGGISDEELRARLLGEDQDKTAESSRQQIMDLIERQQPIPADILTAYAEAFPEEYAEFFTDEAGVPMAPADVARESGWRDPRDERAPSSASGSELIYDTMRELLEELPHISDPMERFTAVQELAGIAGTYEKLRDLEQGSVKMDDGTLITQEMLNNADPALRMQYQQAFSQRQRQVENEARDVFNRYALDQYALDQAAVDGENARRVSETNSAIDSIRTRLERDELNITRAAEEVDRIIRGQQEGRARADLEVKAQQAAQPWATGGKTSFSPADVGFERLAALAGIRDMSAPVIRYPGSMNIDPRGAIQYWDQQGNVAGGTAPMPGVSVSDAEVPRGVQLRGPLPVPQLRAPMTGAITLPPGNPFAQAPRSPSQVPYITMPR